MLYYFKNPRSHHALPAIPVKNLLPCQHDPGCHVELYLFVQGILVGVMLAAPVGPIALVCIQRTLAGGRLHGIMSGLGVATADAFYAALTASGLSLVSAFLLSWQAAFRLAGGTVFVFIGARVFRSGLPDLPARHDHVSFLKDYGSMAAMTLANLLTVVYFSIIFFSVGIVIGTGSWVPAAVFVAGVFCGEAGWWTALCSALLLVRERLTADRLAVINRVSGTVIAGFGLVLLFFVLTGAAPAPAG
jgi:threonine/homoserine/homoserine lactone efflux protein